MSAKESEVAVVVVVLVVWSGVRLSVSKGFLIVFMDGLRTWNGVDMVLAKADRLGKGCPSEPLLPCA